MGAGKWGILMQSTFLLHFARVVSRLMFRNLMLALFRPTGPAWAWICQVTTGLFGKGLEARMWSCRGSFAFCTGFWISNARLAVVRSSIQARHMPRTPLKDLSFLFRSPFSLPFDSPFGFRRDGIFGGALRPHFHCLVLSVWGVGFRV